MNRGSLVNSRNCESYLAISKERLDSLAGSRRTLAFGRIPRCAHRQPTHFAHNAAGKFSRSNMLRSKSLKSSGLTLALEKLVS